MNDGKTGIAVHDPSVTMEIQFEEHKALIVYCVSEDEMKKFKAILQRNDIQCAPDMKYVFNDCHIHRSSEHYHQKFKELQVKFGLDSFSQAFDACLNPDKPEPDEDKNDHGKSRNDFWKDKPGDDGDFPSWSPNA